MRGVQHYVIKFFSDLRQVSGFPPGPPVSSTSKTDRHDITDILLKVALNNIKQTNNTHSVSQVYSRSSERTAIKWCNIYRLIHGQYGNAHVLNYLLHTSDI